MHTEIIKSKIIFEDLPIPVTQYNLNCQGLFIVLVNLLREQQSFVSLVKLKSIKYISKPRLSIITLLRALGQVKKKPLS